MCDLFERYIFCYVMLLQDLHFIGPKTKRLFFKVPAVPKKPVPKEKVPPAVPKKVEAPPAKGTLSSRMKEYTVSQLLCSVLLPVIDLCFPCEFCCPDLVTMNLYIVLCNAYKNIIFKY